MMSLQHFFIVVEIIKLSNDLYLNNKMDKGEDDDQIGDNSVVEAPISCRERPENHA